MAEREQFYVELGMQIRIRREALGLTQAELADGIGISRTSLTNIESGRQRILVDQLVGLSRTLKTSPADLIPMESENDQPQSDQFADLPMVANFVKSVFNESAK